MDTSKTLIEALRARLGGATNYRLAKHLAITKSAVIRYVHGQGGMSYEIGLRVADELGLPAEYVLLCLAAEREQSDQVKPLWRRLATQASGKTAPAERRTVRRAKVAAVLLAAGIPALLAPHQVEARAESPRGVCILRKVADPRRLRPFLGTRARFRRRIRRPRRRAFTAPAALPITC